MMEQQPLSAADVGAVMRANGGYGFGGFGMPMMYPMMGGFGGGFGNAIRGMVQNGMSKQF